MILDRNNVCPLPSHTLANISMQNVKTRSRVANEIKDSSMRAFRSALSPVQPNRGGFTLVELMVVILVIAALMALILPSLRGTVSTVRASAVKAEITRIDTAIAQFKKAYGINPPSFLAIPPVGTSWTGGYSDSRRTLRKIWPQFDFTTNGGLGNTTPLVLSGDECLVLFLGGINTAAPGAAPVFTGFSKNPATPFSATGANRDGPFYELDSGRCRDLDGDNLYSLVDSLPDQTAPMLYISLEGRNKVQVPATPDTFDIYNNNDLSNWSDAGLGNPAYAYHQDVALTVKWKKDSYQIVSPGVDGLFGAPNGSDPDFVGEGFYEAEGESLSREEGNNIGNFNAGTTLGG